jgi:hypothetical protein
VAGYHTVQTLPEVPQRMVAYAYTQEQQKVQDKLDEAKDKINDTKDKIKGKITGNTPAPQAPAQPRAATPAEEHGFKHDMAVMLGMESFSPMVPLEFSKHVVRFAEGETVAALALMHWLRRRPSRRLRQSGLDLQPDFEQPRMQQAPRSQKQYQAPRQPEVLQTSSGLSIYRPSPPSQEVEVYGEQYQDNDTNKAAPVNPKKYVNPW